MSAPLAHPSTLDRRRDVLARAVLRGGALEPGAHRRVTSGNSGMGRHAAAIALSEMRTGGEGRSLSGGASVYRSSGRRQVSITSWWRVGATKRATRPGRPRSFGGLCALYG